MDFLSKISVICFTGSYLVVLGLEGLRLFTDSILVRSKTVGWLHVLFMVAGIFAHAVYLLFHGGLEIGSQGLNINNWFGWCLFGSWILAICYLWISLRQPQTHLGLFLIPAVLAMLGFGYAFGSFTMFSERHVRSIWNLVHGISLLLGTVIVALGFIFGIVYLVQAHRLKRKNGSPRWLQLPSLEWLQQSAERCLIVSAVLLGFGLASGIAISRFPFADETLLADAGASQSRIQWSNPVVWTSAILFGWLLLVTAFSLLYRPARQGRKVAYLVVASFFFLLLELYIAWSVGHATEKEARDVSGQRQSLARVQIELTFFPAVNGMMSFLPTPPILIAPPTRHAAPSWDPQRVLPTLSCLPVSSIRQAVCPQEVGL
jgi:uncharacterized membrane protein YidH (DUF202 family)